MIETKLTLKERIKDIGIDVRLIVICQLCSWILDLAPDTPEGHACLIAVATILGAIEPRTKRNLPA